VGAVKPVPHDAVATENPHKNRDFWVVNAITHANHSRSHHTWTPNWYGTEDIACMLIRVKTAVELVEAGYLPEQDRRILETVQEFNRVRHGLDVFVDIFIANKDMIENTQAPQSIIAGIALQPLVKDEQLRPEKYSIRVLREELSQHVRTYQSQNERRTFICTQYNVHPCEYKPVLLNANKQ
jgi:hypothetical protein